LSQGLLVDRSNVIGSSGADVGGFSEDNRVCARLAITLSARYAV